MADELKLTLTEDGVVLDEMELSRAELTMAQSSGMHARAILDQLCQGQGKGGG